MRTHSYWLLMVLGLSAFVAPVSANVMSEGEPPFWFDAQFMGPPQADGTLRLGLNVGGFYDSSTVGEVHLAVPAGLEVVSGDTTITCNLAGEDRVRTLILRAIRPGTYTIHGSLVVHDERFGTDESELEVGVVVRPDTIIQQPGRVLRRERVNGGQRYRFGGSFMIPIDEPERLTQDELLTSGIRPKVVHKAVARCLACPQTASKSVTWVVFLDRQGKIRDMRTFVATDEKSPEIAATREALRSWSFSAATLAGRTVSDFVVVQVPLNSSE